MRTSHQRHLRTLGPRALAVLSCALALLAAQPLSATATREPIAALRLAGSNLTAEQLPPITRARTTPVDPLALQPIAQSSTRRRHVLATVEILKRLLAFELRPVERPRFFGFAPLAAPDLCTFESVITPPYRIGALDPPRIPAERDFAMAHCLLAPPLA